MRDPYEWMAQALHNSGVLTTVNRADAKDVTGQIKEVDERGLTIAEVVDRPSDTVMNIFIAYRDIRGIGTLEEYLDQH